MTLNQLCLVCEQPLPPGRADRLTCSDRCRTRRARKATQLRARPVGSQWLRQQLRLARPVRFAQGEPTDPRPVEPLHQQAVLPASWDRRLEVMNLLYGLYEELTGITSWQGETGHPPDPVTGEYEGNDVGGVLLQHLFDMRYLLNELHLVRGRESRLLAPLLGPLAEHNQRLATALRDVVAGYQGQMGPYQLVLDTALLAQLAAFQQAISQAWFTLLEQP